MRPLGKTIDQADFSIEIDPAEWAEVVKMANELGPKIGQKAVSKVIDSGTEWTLETMKRFIGTEAENPTGLLQKSLGKKKKRKYEPSFFISAISVNVGNKRGDGAFYWNIVEQGHRIVTPKKIDTGRKVAAMRYALMSFEMAKPIVLSDFARKVRSELNKAWERKAKT